MSGLHFDDIRRIRARHRGIAEHSRYELEAAFRYSNEQVLCDRTARALFKRHFALMLVFGSLFAVLLASLYYL